MVTMPGEAPVTTPVPGTTVAVVVLPLVQVPVVVISLRFVDVPTQILVFPVIGEGDGVKFTELLFVAAQPELVAVAV